MPDDARKPADDKYDSSLKGRSKPTGPVTDSDRPDIASQANGAAPPAPQPEIDPETVERSESERGSG